MIDLPVGPSLAFTPFCLLRGLVSSVFQRLLGVHGACSSCRWAGLGRLW
jgi:hypothetical protein